MFSYASYGILFNVWRTTIPVRNQENAEAFTHVTHKCWQNCTCIWSHNFFISSQNLFKVSKSWYMTLTSAQLTGHQNTILGVVRGLEGLSLNVTNTLTLHLAVSAPATCAKSGAQSGCEHNQDACLAHMCA